MARKAAKATLFDTYALIAAATGLLTPRAEQEVRSVRRGERTGVIHYLIAYEFLYHWRRGGIRGLETATEAFDFLRFNFRFRPLAGEVASAAAALKIKADTILQRAAEPALRRRRLSTADCTTLAIAASDNLPIITGDPDLTYVAKALGAPVIS